MLDQIWYLFSLELKRRILLDLNSFPNGTALSGKRIPWQWGRGWAALRSPGWEGPAALGLGRLCGAEQPGLLGHRRLPDSCWLSLAGPWGPGLPTGHAEGWRGGGFEGGRLCQLLFLWASLPGPGTWVLPHLPGSV